MFNTTTTFISLQSCEKRRKNCDVYSPISGFISRREFIKGYKKMKKTREISNDLFALFSPTMLNPMEMISLSENLLFYSTVCIFAIGCIGNVIHLCVLITLKQFRSNQCAFYLIVESIVDTCQLSVLFLINLLPMILNFEPANRSLVWCKLKNMLPQTLRLISTSFVCFAAFDQFLSTNPQPFVRQMSTLRLAYRLTFVAVCLWTAHSIPYGIFYQISTTSGSCTMPNVKLTEYYSYFYYPVLHGFLPILFASLSSLFAYRNVRRLVRRQLNIERRRLDRQLTAMIFVRVIFFVLFLLPYTIYRIYVLNFTISRANLYPYAVDRLIFATTATLTNFNYTVRELKLIVNGM